MKFSEFSYLMRPTDGAKMKKSWEVKMSCPGWFDMELPWSEQQNEVGELCEQQKAVSEEVKKHWNFFMLK